MSGPVMMPLINERENVQVKSQTLKVSKVDYNEGQIEGLPKNPRFIHDGRFNKLVKSISDAPEMLELREIIVTKFENRFVAVCGNMRLRACRELGLDNIPCKILPAETPPEKLREYAIKDNIEMGEDDEDALAELWDADELSSWGLDVFDTFTPEPQTGKELEKHENVNPTLPIIPQYNESYHTVVVFAKSDMEMVFLKNLLKLETKKSYKNSFTGKCYVTTADEVQNALADYLSK